MSKYARGYIPDPNGHRVTSFRFAKVSAASVPSSFDLTSYCPAVLDQNQCGSCVGHGIAGAIATHMAFVGSSLGYVPSPRLIYQLARCLDRADPMAPLQDVGSMPSVAIGAINTFGIGKMVAPSPQGYNSDCDLGNVNDEPLLSELEQEGHALIVGQYAIDSTGSQCIIDVCSAISNGYPVAVASFVDTEFENLNSSSPPYNIPNTSDPNGGGHYIFLMGYSTVNGKKQFRLQNSWTSQWADGGRCWVTEEFVQQCTDRYALNVRKVAR